MRNYIFAFLCVTLCACYSPRYVYSPPTQNIPVLTRKNDVQLSAFYAGSINAFKEKGNYNRGFDFQAAWAVSNHFAVMVNESARWEKNGGNDSFFANDSSFLSYKRSFTELGAGYCTYAESPNKMKFQVFGGMAFGSSRIMDDFISNNTQENKYHYSRVTKIFVQPALIYNPFKNFFTELSSRFTEISFAHIRTNYTSSELHNYILDSIAVSPVFFWEPAFSYTFGFKNIPVKFQIQGSLTILINHRFVEHRNGNVGIGLIYNFLKSVKNKPAPGNKEAH